MLRLERTDRRLNELSCNAPPGQVVPDQGVAGSPLGQGSSAARCKALVVDGSSLNQAFHDLTAYSWSDLGPRQPLGQFLLGQIPAPERAGGLRHRRVPDELTADSPRSITVELHADVQARRQHDFGRQRSPVLPFELDLDAPAWTPAKSANPWRRPLR
jgi:hypothetical protein